MPHDALGRHDLAGHAVVGDVEQGRDERAVGGLALLEPRLAVDGGVGQGLGVEAALGPGGHDDGVLDHLRLDEAEDLGAEVLAAVGPPQPAPRHRAEAQVHALDPRAVDEDLELRARRGEVGDRARVELQRDVAVELGAVTPLLVVVRAQPGPDDPEEGPDDPVVVQAGDVVEGVEHALGDLVGLLGAGGVGGPAVAVGVEAGPPQRDQVAGHAGVRDQGVLEVVLRVGGAGLPEVLRDGAQDDDLAPGQVRGQDELVEPVGLGTAVPDRGDGSLEQLAEAVVRAGVPERPLGHAEAEVVDVQGGAVGPLDLERLLVDDLDAHVGEDRQDVGERERLDAEQLEPADVARPVERAVERHARAAALAEPVEVAHVGEALADGEGLLVRRREGAAEAVEEPVALLLAVGVAQHVAEAVRPGAAHLDQALLQGVELRGVEGAHAPAALDADDELQPRERRLADPGGELDVDAAEGLPEDLGHPQPHRRVVAVARDEDQARDEAAELVLADEELGAPALLQLGDGDRGLVEVVDVGLEELVARVALEDPEQVLAGVAVRGDPGPLEHRLDLLGDERHPHHRLGVRGGRVEAEEAALADDLAVGAVGPDADVVEVRHPVDGGLRVGLREHEQVLLVGHLRRLAAQDVGLLAERRVGAQEAEAAAGDRCDDLALVGLLEAVVAVAEEGEVVVGHPAEEPRGQGHLVGVDALRRRPLELGRDDEALAAHLRPVLDGLPHVLEHLAHVALDLGPALLVALAVDDEQHPGLGELPDRAGAELGGDVAVLDLLQPADGVADDDELRVDDEVDVDALADEGAGDRVDEERHVVGDDLDDGAGARPAVGVGARVEHAHVGGAGHPGAPQLELAVRRPGVGLGAARGELVVGHVPEVALAETGAPPVRRQLREDLRDRCEDLVAGGGLDGRHGAVALLRRVRRGAAGHALVPRLRE